MKKSWIRIGSLRDNPVQGYISRKEISLGSIVKICDGQERFWVTVNQIIDHDGHDTFIGSISNNLLGDNGYDFGDNVAFFLSEIWDVETPKEEQPKKGQEYFVFDSKFIEEVRKHLGDLFDWSNVKAKIQISKSIKDENSTYIRFFNNAGEPSDFINRLVETYPWKANGIPVPEIRLSEGRRVIPMEITFMNSKDLEKKEEKEEKEEEVHAKHLICLASNGAKNLLVDWSSLSKTEKITKLAHLAKMLCQSLETLSGVWAA
jgi:hypothetical protein